jgi:hypothetical protein
MQNILVIKFFLGNLGNTKILASVFFRVGTTRIENETGETTAIECTTPEIDLATARTRSRIGAEADDKEIKMGFTTQSWTSFVNSQQMTPPLIPFSPATNPPSMPLSGFIEESLLRRF